MKNISGFIGKHAGKHAWIFGKGPGLDNFDMATAGTLRICINESITVVPKPLYFFAHDKIPIQISARKWPENCKAILQNERTEYALECGIPESSIYTYTKKNKDKNVLCLSPEEIIAKNVLYGCSGTVHSAIHFCYLIGVEHIVFVGFDGKGGYAKCLQTTSKGKIHSQIKKDSLEMLKILDVSHSDNQKKSKKENYPQKLFAKKFDELYQQDDQRYSWLYKNGYQEGPVKRLIKFSGSDLSCCKKILDAGCGLQTFAKYMKENGYNGEIVGVDLSSYIAETAQHCKVIHCSLDNIPYDDNFFDGLFCCDVLEHVHEERITNTLKELSRVLKTNGYWTFSIGTGKSFFKGPQKENLHVTIQSDSWWENHMSKWFGNVKNKEVPKGGVLLSGNKSFTLNRNIPGKQERQKVNFDQKWYEEKYTSSWIGKCLTKEGLKKHLEATPKRYKERFNSWFSSIKLEGKLLELGFNDGKSIYWLHQKYPSLQIDALDFNTTLKSVEKSLRSMVPSLVDVMYCNCTNIDKPNCFYDAITSIDFFEHLPRSTYLESLEECYRLLNNRGKFLVYLGKTKVPSHINLMPISKLIEDANQVGFSKCNSYSHSGEVLTIFTK